MKLYRIQSIKAFVSPPYAVVSLTFQFLFPLVSELLLLFDVLEGIFEAFLLDAQILLDFADFVEGFRVSLRPEDLVKRLLHGLVFPDSK